MKSIRHNRFNNLAALMIACGVGLGGGLGTLLIGAGAADAGARNSAPVDAAPVATDSSTATASSGAAREGALHRAPSSRVHLDRSGDKQVGTASFYAARYSGKTMADGTPMRLYSNNAASLTMPLGTTAKVTNLQTGRSAVVTIRDRGPYARGRIIDLSPATARSIGISRTQGLAKVEVVPLSLPLPDGTVKVASNM